MAKSILQKGKFCYKCGNTLNLQLHHVYYGTANRKLSDLDGCVVWLCLEHHTGNSGIHFNKKLDIEVKQIMQRKWMETYNKTLEDFRNRYGKSYI